ncbi:MAG: hypothetical protein COB02_16600 [Candidatus Cloacimonadota bacterium]|nr:MAG: hypothetical protein COB02_16600 [Candidatus Cloacimonadota bacterium]
MKLIKYLITLCLILNLNYSIDLPHQKLTYPALTLNIPDVNKFSLQNGLKVYFLQDSSLPIIKMSLFVKGGSFIDNKQLTGLSSLLASIQRDGGNSKMTPSQLDQYLEERGATISTNSGDMTNGASLKCLSADLKDVMPLYVSTILHPKFNKARFQLQKKLLLESIRRQNDEPKDVLRRKFTKLIYKSHKAGNTPNFKSIQNIKLSHIKLAHSTRFIPNDAQLLVVGDITLKKLKALLNKSFSSWKPTSNSIKIDTTMKLDFKSEKVFIEMDTPQLNIRIGHKSLKISNPDYFPLLIADYILGGGGFNSRLMQRVRTEMGLAYSIYSYIWGDVYYGSMGVYCGTKTSGAVDSISEILKQIDKVRDEKVSQQEFDLAKNSMINQYVFKFSSKYQIINRILYFERKNLPENFMQYYLDSLKKVTIEDVQVAAKKYWKPKSLKILLVGKVSTIKKELETKFGKFTEQKLEKVQ